MTVEINFEDKLREQTEIFSNIIKNKKRVIKQPVLESLNRLSFFVKNNYASESTKKFTISKKQDKSYKGHLNFSITQALGGSALDVCIQVAVATHPYITSYMLFDFSALISQDGILLRKISTGPFSCDILDLNANLENEENKAIKSIKKYTDNTFYQKMVKLAKEVYPK